MVSFQAPVSSNFVHKVPEHVENLDRSSSKRKSMVHHNDAEEHQAESLIKKSKPALSLHFTPSVDSRTESVLDAPLPVDWQQCLDIQSGEVHFYNARTKTRTSKDPREGSDSLELPRRSRSPHMRLDLELNSLPCDESYTSDSKRNHKDFVLNLGINKENMKQIINVPTKESSTEVTSSVPSWLAFEGDEKSEMVATVCKRCFMLVMLCKASPACPNCKFMHSPDQSTPYLFKRTLTQLLY